MLTVLAVDSSQETSTLWRGQDISLDDERLFKQVINTKETLALSRTQNATLTEAESQLLQQRGVTDLLIVPLLLETEAVGTLTVGFEEADEDMTAKINFLEDIAALVAKGIVKTQLYKTMDNNP